MDDFKIMSGIEAPVRQEAYGKWVDVASRMAIGDCVDVPNRANAKCITSSLRRQGFRPVIRQQPDGSIRVWKVAK